MPYIDNVKFKEILNAARNGNEKAKMVMQGMRKMSSQEDIDRLVGDYYAIPTAAAPIDEQPQVQEQAPIPQELEPEVVEETANPQDVVDISDVLARETEGLFDEDEYQGVSFYEFLKNKKSDANRAMKNSDYFKAFDSDGRNAYADSLIDKYRHKFDNNLRDVEREFSDNDRAISGYAQSVNDMLDDGVEFGTDAASSAYNDLIDNESAMSGFGRYWDENDTSSVLSAIKELVDKYGKANVLSVLNVLRADNNSHRDYLNNSIDTNIAKYSKNIDKLLR
jgi:hypothetical protein